MSIEQKGPEMSQAAAMLGRKGGLSKSVRKAEASRANGAKGGRPKKRPIDEREGPLNKTSIKTQEPTPKEAGDLKPSDFAVEKVISGNS